MPVERWCLWSTAARGVLVPVEQCRDVVGRCDAPRVDGSPGGAAAGAVLGALAGLGTPALVAALPPPRGLAAGDPGPDYRALGARRRTAPAAAGAGAVLAAALGWRLGWAAALPFWHLVAVGLALTVVDLAVHRLPDRLVLPSLAAAPVLVALAAAATGTGPAAVLRAVAGGAAGLALWGSLHLVHQAGLGRGDVKLGAWTGLVTGWLGWPALVGGVVAAVLLGGVVAAVVLAAGGSRRTAVPFGPVLLAGAVAAALAAGPPW